MGANAPARILNVEKKFRARADRPKSYKFSGVAGDVNHSFGYHCSPRDLPSGDYSLQTARDERGAHEHPGDASAWDQSYDPRDMKLVTQRLLAAAKAKDPRMAAVREFCGTLNGYQTYPWDCHSNSSEGVGSWDDSHLWHVHVSLYRDASEAQIGLLLDVLCGVPAKPRKPVTIESPFPYRFKPGHVIGAKSSPSSRVHGGITAAERRINVPVIHSLRLLGFYDGPHGTREITAEVVKAIRAFQRARMHAKRATGTVGLRTWLALRREVRNLNKKAAKK